ncbi:hypothetical protein [Dyadobacter sp. LHD-138]|uniref:hypothetical protein n=1 Tax=Dyadobacter sp. LHD-138 TaxID=3071413 RepID=UPI0027DFBF36|nr:hypothetical protein [Dyadobacter sp. LHD-138]MDQ6478241.1 hypothetical protein [Dyadobacter sp. LHD-138]
MKKLLSLFILATFLTSCGSKKEVSPASARIEIWSAGCASFGKVAGGYAISGMCCERVEMPFFALKNGASFSARGKYFASREGKSKELPITITGNLSADAQTLTLNYAVDNVPKSFTMKIGKPVMACYCGCG